MMVVILVIAVLAMGYLAVYVRRRARRFLNSAEVQLMRELVRSAQNGELQQEEPPRSLGGMTSIYLPQILRDFPEFNWEELRAAVEEQVQSFLETQTVKSAGAVRIHKTVISRYQKYHGTASILCETAAEYWIQERKKQTVCLSELIYVYDSGLSGAAVSLVCPNCGAPVEQLGTKQCRYCGSVLEVSGAKVWKVQNVRERM